MNKYYDTTNALQVKVHEAKAKSQDEKVYAIFKSLPTQCFSRDRMIKAYKHFYYEDMPIASCTRSLNTLTKTDMIKKTDQKVMGSNGRLVHQWKFK